MTMECRDVRPLAEAFLSDQLQVETTQAIVAHLERCPACRADLDGLRRLRAAARSAFASEASLAPRPEFLASLGDRVRTAAAHPPAAASSRRWWLPVAASLLLLAGTGAAWRQWSIGSLLALVDSAVGDHRFCALTFRLTEAPIALEEAAARYGAVNRAMIAVEPSAAPLSGGPVQVLERHSCVFEGRRFVHLVLQYKGTPLSLLVAAADPGVRLFGLGAAGTVVRPTAAGFQVASFREAGYMVFLVSSLGQDDVHDVAQAMIGPVALALAGA